MNVAQFLEKGFPEKFSFEQDYLEKPLRLEQYRTKAPEMFGLVQDTYFIDIGIPEDFKKAQHDFASMPLDLKKITKDWTLFLDRDGVINEEKPGSYIFNPDEFVFYEGVLKALKTFTGKFGKIIVITNQRGIGKGLMTDNDLTAIHDKLLLAAKNEGATIDGIYYCSSVNPWDPNRKPNPGMATKAKKDFPGINLRQSIMVGNTPGDMRFGRNAGMYTVFIKTTKPDHPFPHVDIDLAFNSLIDFARAL